MNQQTRFHRCIIFARKKITSIILGMKLSSIHGRFIGPRVLLNSIPKSGTNLLERTLIFFPLLRSAGKRTLICWESVNKKTINKIKKIKKGQFFTTHLTAQKELFSLIKKENIRVIFIIRDPRDVVVSHFKYVTQIDTTHRTHKYFKLMGDDNKRLKTVINGGNGIVAPIDEVLKRFEPWLKNKNTLAVRFEDLVGAMGGGNKVRQFETIKAIAHHLGILIDDDEIYKICTKAYSTKSPTFRSGNIGGWREYFTDEHLVDFNKRVGRLLYQYGYKSN